MLKNYYTVYIVNETTKDRSLFQVMPKETTKRQLLLLCTKLCKVYGYTQVEVKDEDGEVIISRYACDYK